jgi:hypothetical protein
MTTKNPLPQGITEKDTQPRGGHTGRRYDLDFQLWFVTGMGWVIPTVLISRQSRRHRNLDAATDRTYAVTLDGKVCRVGAGPHVTEVVHVHVHDSHLKSLQRFIDLKREGAAKAGMIRDRISSRRAEGQLHRAAGERSWRWGTK